MEMLISEYGESGVRNGYIVRSLTIRALDIDVYIGLHNRSLKTSRLLWLLIFISKMRK
jgi:hypothetical protein